MGSVLVTNQARKVMYSLDTTPFTNGPNLGPIWLNYQTSAALFGRPDGPTLKNIASLVIVSKSLDFSGQK